MLRFVEVFGGVLVLGRVAAPDVAATEAQAQVNPGVASLNAVLAHMLIRLFDFDLVRVGALLRHCFLQESASQFRSSDHGHVTKGHNHCQEPQPSLTIVLEVLHLCFGSIIYLAY
jgi:hypothetical protein